MNKLQKICSKCDQPYHQHVQTGAGEWICPSKEEIKEMEDYFNSLTCTDCLLNEKEARSDDHEGII